MGMKTLVRVTLAITLVVILLGAYTRLSDAGLGCPDWPGCYGQLTVPTHPLDLERAQLAFPSASIEQDKAWLEMIHRYAAGSLGLMVLGIWLLHFRRQSPSIRLPSGLLVLVIFQAALGMWTVTLKLMPIVVMAHLIGGFALFSLLFLLYVRRFSQPVVAPLQALVRLAPLALLGLLALVLQIMLGGWTSANYAALACTTLPLCDGDWLSRLNIVDAFNLFATDHPSYEFGVLDYTARATIHISHRIWAIVTALLLLALAILLLLRAQTGPLRNAAWLLLFTLLLQLGLGVSNVLFQLPLPVAVAHNGGAAMLLLVMVYINDVLRCQRKLLPIAANKQGGVSWQNQ